MRGIILYDKQQEKEREAMDNLIKAVKDHAKDNYENGWDVVVECYEDAELAEVIGQARTVRGAIKKVGRHIKLWNERRTDIESTAW